MFEWSHGRAQRVAKYYTFSHNVCVIWRNLGVNMVIAHFLSPDSSIGSPVTDSITLETNTMEHSERPLRHVIRVH